MNTDLFGNPVRPAEVDVPPPSGLLDDGLVRTTGWLQLGARPISSGLVAALVCLPHAVVLALALMPASPVAALLTALLLPLVCAGVRLLVHTLVPASRARNVEVLPAGDLTAGLAVRLYGSIGLVGRIRSTAVADGQVDVGFEGGTTFTWAADRPVQVVELLS
jgi:hypothetical protein